MAKQIKVKHQKIYEHIHQGILSGDYSVGERIPTEAELGLRFDASRVTVSRALRDLERQGLLVRRRGAGTFVRQPKPASKHLIGLLTGETPGIFSTVGEEISRVAHASGFGVVLGKWPVADIDEIIRRTRALNKQYMSHSITGVIFEPMYVPAEHMHFNEEIANDLVRVGIPVVLLDRDICDYPRRSGFDLVGVDNRQGGYHLTEHLISLGRRRIHFLSQSLVASTVTARYLGYQDSLAHHGIVSSPQQVHAGDKIDEALMWKLIKTSRADAFVCANDFEAAKLLHALASMGVRIPDDVAIVGFNDDPYAALLTVSLTTMRQPCADLGATAVNVMLKRIENPSAAPVEIRLSCELVVRESCGSRSRLS